MTDFKSSKITKRVIAGIVIVAALWAILAILGTKVWLSDTAVLIWNHLLETSELPNWGLYLLIAIGTPTFIQFLVIIKKPKGPSIASYNHDTFLGLNWRWSYLSEHPVSAWAFCPDCDTALIYSDIGSRFDPDRKTVLTCDTCNHDLLYHEGNKDYLVQRIHRQIETKIRNEEWKHVVETRS